MKGVSGIDDEESGKILSILDLGIFYKKKKKESKYMVELGEMEENSKECMF